MTRLCWDLSGRFGSFELDSSEDVSFQRLAVFGPSGAGKTTLLDLLAGHRTPEDGRIEYGEEVLLDSSRSIRHTSSQRGFGYFMQDAPLFPDRTVRRNLLYSGRTALEEGYARNVLDMLEIGQLLDRMPGELSGGENQRVGLAQVLFSRPRLVLLDEPLTGLNETLVAEILPKFTRVLDELELPAVIVSHRLDVVSGLCETVVPIQSGRTEGSYPVDSVLQSNMFREQGLIDATNTFECRVLETHNDGLIRVETERGLTFLLPETETFAEGDSAVIRFSATEPVLARNISGTVSTRNRWNGTLRRKEQDRGGVLITLRVGEEILWSRVTDRTVKELNLRPEAELEVLLKSSSIRAIPVG